MPSGWSLDPDGNIGARWMVTTLKAAHRNHRFRWEPATGDRTRLTDLLAPAGVLVEAIVWLLSRIVLLSRSFANNKIGVVCVTKVGLR